MPYSFTVRVSRKYDDVFDWVDAIKCKCIAVYEHEQDDEVNRTHIHMVVIDSEVNTDALKTRYKKLYGGIDKTDWMFKYGVTADNKFITYMSKGHLAPKLTKGYEVSEIQRLTAEWIDPKQINLKLDNGKFVRDVNEPNQKTKIQLLEQMRSQVSDTDTTRDILKKIRKVLIDNKVVVGMYKMMDYYDSLIMYARKEDWICGMEKKIISRDCI